MGDGSDNSSKQPPPSLQQEGAFSVVTWNVNSVKARLPILMSYLKEKKPAVMMLQEIKTENDSFPAFELQSIGYQCRVKGQKSYNGAALLSTEQIELIRDDLPGAPDNEQARFIDAYIPRLGSRFISIYVPNGEPPANDPDSTSRLEYKLAFMDALADYATTLAGQDVPFVIGGDFNVIEYDTDVYNPAAFKNSAFTVLPVKERFRSFYYTGLTNALRQKSTAFPLYSYWDYRAAAWEKNNGILLDHLFLSPVWADRLISAEVDSYTRGLDKASDHAPVRCSLSLN